MQFEIDNLPAGTYYFRVRSRSGNWYSKSTTDILRVDVPPIPKMLEVQRTFISGFEAGWEPIESGLNGYFSYQICEKDDFTGTILSGMTTATSVSFSGLKNNAFYYYRAKALYDGGLQSLWSEKGIALTGPINGFMINGSVTEQSTALSGVTLTLNRLNGPEVAIVTTASGLYDFILKPKVYSYTLTPSKEFYSFIPESLAIENVSGNMSQNFVAERNHVKIYGFAKTPATYYSDGKLITGGLTAVDATITISGSNGYSNSAITTTEGYLFNDIDAGYDYTISVSGVYEHYESRTIKIPKIKSNTEVSFQAKSVTLDSE